jgi:hypothetical protein
MTFLMKTSEKKIVKVICEAFFILNKYFAHTIQELFSFLQKGFYIPKQ